MSGAQAVMTQFAGHSCQSWKNSDELAMAANTDSDSWRAVMTPRWWAKLRNFVPHRQEWNVNDVDLLDLLTRTQPHDLGLGWI